jgi:cytochrome o ubiquinol oxidase operon protein cyoD
MNQTRINSTGARRGNLKSYGTGFILSIALTILSFALVMTGTLSHSTVLFGIFAAAAVQIAVHLHYFLHLDTSSAMRWNVLALVFALLIMILFIGGTIWIMFHLKHCMMVS